MAKKTEIKKISASLINLFLSCPLKFKYYEIDKIVGEPRMPQHLIYGGAIHKAVEEFHKGIWHGKRLTLKQMTEIFADVWQWELEFLENPISWYKASQEEEMLKAGLASIEAYYTEHELDPPPPPFIDEGGNIVPAVEAKFLLPLDDLCKNKGYHLVGVIDLIEVSDKSINIIDHKTSAAKYSNFQIKTNLQLPIYSWSFRALTNMNRFPHFKPGTKEDYVVFDVLLKKRPVIVPQKRKVSKPTYTHLAHIIDTMINQIERKEFLPNYGAECSAYGGCDYADICADYKFK